MASFLTLGDVKGWNMLENSQGSFNVSNAATGFTNAEDGLVIGLSSFESIVGC